MKKLTFIFLFAIICINHLNIIDAISCFSVSHNTEKLVKKHLNDEEREKENKAEDKLTEQEKYLNRNTYSAYPAEMSAKDKFHCYNIRLNIHPFQDDDIQPPKAV